MHIRRQRNRQHGAHRPICYFKEQVCSGFLGGFFLVCSNVPLVTDAPEQKCCSMSGKPTNNSNPCGDTFFRIEEQLQPSLWK